MKDLVCDNPTVTKRIFEKVIEFIDKGEHSDFTVITKIIEHCLDLVKSMPEVFFTANSTFLDKFEGGLYKKIDFSKRDRILFNGKMTELCLIASSRKMEFTKCSTYIQKEVDAFVTEKWHDEREEEWFIEAIKNAFGSCLEFLSWVYQQNFVMQNISFFDKFTLVLVGSVMQMWKSFEPDSEASCSDVEIYTFELMSKLFSINPRINIRTPFANFLFEKVLKRIAEKTEIGLVNHFETLYQLLKNGYCSRKDDFERILCLLLGFIDKEDKFFTFNVCHVAEKTVTEKYVIKALKFAILDEKTIGKGKTGRITSDHNLNNIKSIMLLVQLIFKLMGIEAVQFFKPVVEKLSLFQVANFTCYRICYMCTLLDILELLSQLSLESIKLFKEEKIANLIIEKIRTHLKSETSYKVYLYILARLNVILKSEKMKLENGEVKRYSVLPRCCNGQLFSLLVDLLNGSTRFRKRIDWGSLSMMQNEMFYTSREITFEILLHYAKCHPEEVVVPCARKLVSVAMETFSYSSEREKSIFFGTIGRLCVNKSGSEILKNIENDIFEELLNSLSRFSQCFLMYNEIFCLGNLFTTFPKSLESKFSVAVAILEKIFASQKYKENPVFHNNLLICVSKFGYVYKERILKVDNLIHYFLDSLIDRYTSIRTIEICNFLYHLLIESLNSSQINDRPIRSKILEIFAGKGFYSNNHDAQRELTIDLAINKTVKAK